MASTARPKETQQERTAATEAQLSQRSPVRGGNRVPNVCLGIYASANGNRTLWCLCSLGWSFSLFLSFSHIQAYILSLVPMLPSLKEGCSSVRLALPWQSLTEVREWRLCPACGGTWATLARLGAH